ncbi:Flp family type IVb pilin [Asticcacaulis taihuensis]|uniref:Flp family type IVb pilin n=1 Tax=Asticcacaulis taihuensis TaxID=260084 RepID=UPI0026F12392|nr:Flp family type IVb pilin [Asticcacaulis taihuensis]
MSKFVTSFLKDESGASAAEYVLILALVGLAVAIGAATLGTSLSTAMSTTAGKVDAAVK